MEEYPKSLRISTMSRDCPLDTPYPDEEGDFTGTRTRRKRELCPPSESDSWRLFSFPCDGDGGYFNCPYMSMF